MKPFKFLTHLILLDPKKENHTILSTYNKECFTNVTKAPITGKTKLIDPKLETAKLDIGIHGTEKFSMRYSVYVYYANSIMHVYK